MNNQTRPHPLLAMGFRPFFLLAALHAIFAVPLWILKLRGLDLPVALPGTAWHAHEMIFGFAMAVIAGFLLTAVRNWTKRMTAEGPQLAALVMLWLAGRAAMYTDLPLLAAGLNLAFIPALGVVVARPLIGARSTRNYKILALLAGFWLAQLVFFADALGLDALSGYGGDALRVALDLVVLLVLVIAGRIVPLFTRNATKVQTIKNWPAADGVALVATLVAALLAPTPAPAALVAGVLALAGVAVFVRMIPWGARHTLRSPILWILHLGHAWVGVGLLLRAAEKLELGVVLPSATHALSFGAVGTVIIGMMARVSLGHTGRKLTLHPAITVSFVLFTLGAVVRTLTPLASWEGGYLHALDLASALWALAFVIFAIVYTPILIAPRPDAKAG